MNAACAVLAARVALPGAATVPESGAPVLPTAIMVFPAGQHHISATRDGRTWEGTVEVNAATATAMQTALTQHFAGLQKPFFDFSHDNASAAAWPQRFYWRNDGVWADVEWSAPGAEAIAGRAYRSFSPAFFTDGAKPVEHVTGAPLNMGGIVNDPAFEAQKPIWAQAARNQNPNPTTMDKSQLTALLGLAEKATDAEILAALEALKGTEAQTKQLAEEVERLKTAAAEAEVVAAKRAADTAVEAAITAGRLAPKDTAAHKVWRDLIAKNPSAITALNAIPVNPLIGRVTPPVSTAAPVTAKASLADGLRAYHAAHAPADRAAIYAEHVRTPLAKGAVLGPILAANSLGSLAGDLVVQRSFDLLKAQYPWLQKITTDFSAEGANYGQTIKTRAKTAISAVDYTPGTGYTRGNAATPDISIALSNHKGCEVAFNANELSGTNRDLIGEQSEVVMAAIGDALAAAVIACITGANFPTSAVTNTAGTATRANCTALAKALTKNKALLRDRFVLLNLDCYESLGNDAAIVALASSQRAELIEQFLLPQVAGLQPYGVNLFPTATTSGTIQGFAGTPASLAIATRLPGDYADGATGNGTVRTVQSDFGIAVQLVEYVDHKLAERALRAALIYGAAAGVANAGVRFSIA